MSLSLNLKKTLMCNYINQDLNNLLNLFKSSCRSIIIYNQLIIDFLYIILEDSLHIYNQLINTKKY